MENQLYMLPSSYFIYAPVMSATSQNVRVAYPQEPIEVDEKTFLENHPNGNVGKQFINKQTHEAFLLVTDEIFMESENGVEEACLLYNPQVQKYITVSIIQLNINYEEVKPE